MASSLQYTGVMRSGSFFPCIFPIILDPYFKKKIPAISERDNYTFCYKILKARKRKKKIFVSNSQDKSRIRKKVPHLIFWVLTRRRQPLSSVVVLYKAQVAEISLLYEFWCLPLLEDFQRP